MQIIPAVDVLDGRVVRLRQGDFADSTVYGDDPVEAVSRWHDEGAPLVHVVDLGGARTGEADRDLWSRLGAAGAPFQIGGGIRDAEAAAAALTAGARRVAVGTAAVWSPGVLAAMIETVGAGAVVVAVDVDRRTARGAGWEDEGRPVEEVVSAAVEAGAESLLVTSIVRDGMLIGPDTYLLDEVRALAPEVELIASGGVGSLADLRAAAATGAAAAIVGRALYEGRFSYAEAVEAVSR
jgi:phosphoribosylformimino-5-aminoimidazole carboxamide ribotide isomerase